MDEEFIIPVKHEDLLKEIIDQESRYVVSKVKVKEESVEKDIDAISEKIREDPTAIFSNENFDYLYSVMSVHSSLSYDSKYILFELLKNGFIKLIDNIKFFLSDENTDESLYDPEEYKKALHNLRNPLKMYIYLIQWFISAEEATLKKKNETANVKEKGARKGRKKNSSEVSSPWEIESEKIDILSNIVKMLEIDLALLWSLSTTEESFNSLIVKIAFVILEANLKSKELKKNAFDILGLLSTKYNNSSDIAESVLDVMRKVDNLVNVFIDMSEYIIKEFNFTPIISDLLRNISKITSSEFEKNATLAKNASSFIAEVTERLPKHILPSISLLLPYLDGDNSTMRNGVIQSIGYIVSKANKFNITEEEETSYSVKTRDSLLDVLLERFKDKTSYTRSKAIQTWMYLCQERAIPLSIYNQVAEKTVERLEDKSSIVRKSAIQLLSYLLQYNPYSSQLKLTQFNNGLEKTLRKIEDKEDILENISFEYISQGHDGDILSQEVLSLEETERNDEKYIKVLTYYKSAIQFIQTIHNGISILSNLLGSKITSDVLETISFFTTAKSFGIEKSEEGIRKMTMLIWSKESQIKENLISAFMNIYLTPPDHLEKKLSNLYIAKNLIGLVKNRTLGELTSLEELLTIIFKDNMVSNRIIDILWDIFVKAEGEERRNSLAILSMIANSNPQIIISKINVLASIALSDPLENNLHLVKWACIALQKLVPKASKNEKTEITKIKPNHVIFERLAELIELGVKLQNDIPKIGHWFTAADQAINTIYLICKNPDSILSPTIKRMTEFVFTSGKTESQAIEPFKLAALFHVVGHTALKQLVYVEQIGKLIQKQKLLLSKKIQQDDTTIEAIEKELGGLDIPGESPDEEQKRLKVEWDIAENNLLGSFLPLIAKVCVDSSKTYSDPLLRNSAFNALCKFMLISPRTCEKFMQLLCTALANKSTNSTLKANIIIALGDLSFRHPNIVEPWTHYIYSCLSDPDSKVRKNTLMVLTHLILNDMIKVKGQISEMAICLEDSNPRIVDLAKLFFHELSGKGNTIYNVLPDTISGLSQNENISYEQFKGILKYLFSFIEKDRQIENLVDKLCKRFPTTGDSKQWRYIAYCISIINVNEKSVKKLIENIKLCKEALLDQHVYELFQKVVEKCQKSTKAELKELGEELNNVIKSDSEESTTSLQNSKPQTTTEKSQQKKKKKKVLLEESDSDMEIELNDDDDDENENEEMEVEKQAPPPRRSTRRR